MGSKCGKRSSPQPGLNESRMEHAREAFAENEESHRRFEGWLEGCALCYLDRVKDTDGGYSNKTVALMFSAFKEGRRR